VPRLKKPDPADFEQANAELSASLARCRELLRDCQSKLVANTNNKKGERDPSRPE
jgi:hypothetical protein